MLRDFQLQAKNDIYTAWNEGVTNVMVQLPTGGGKTVLFCDIVRELDRPACVIAHRQELVGQAALALNRERVSHAIIAPKKVIQQIITLEHEEHGYTTYNSRAPVRAAGVDTIIRSNEKDRWFSQVEYVVQDEGHHVQRENKWGCAMGMFTHPHVRGLFPTAHPMRADGKGLGREAGGLADRIVLGPNPRTLMNRGFLTDYRLICADSDIEFKDVPIGPSGELNQPKLRAVTHKSKKLIGDVVEHYLRYGAGKLGATFVVDIEEAIKQRDAYQKAGVPAEIITADTPISTRSMFMRQFRQRKILQLVSVDCLGEGVDVPGIEIVSLARRTASWQLLCQQIGRSWRVMVDDVYWKHWDRYSDEDRVNIIGASSKPKAIVIDHVGNILWHAQFRGLPDSQQEYTLLKTGLGGGRKTDAIPSRVCVNCSQPYERFHVFCPHCKFVPVVAGRSSPELVDGDLVELDPQVMAALRGEMGRVNGPAPIFPGMNATVQRAVLSKHHDRYRAQQSLQRYLMLWGGWQVLHKGLDTRAAQKLFYLRYGVDVMTAQTLGATEATNLESRIATELQRNNVYESLT